MDHNLNGRAAAITYEAALARYFNSDQVYVSPSLEAKLWPSHGASERTDADDGWHFRNINGWLATVLDDGTVIAVADDDETDEKWLERVRYTRAEADAQELLGSSR